MAAEQPGVHLAWRGLTYDVAVGKDAPGAGLNGAPAGHKRILHGLTGEAVPGSVLAVMGPSGSGKSTLIAALGGRLAGSVGGEVILNGARSANAVPPELVHLVGYVAQEDYLFGVLTVRETLNFSLMLRMSHLTTKERDEVVGRAIREFDLEECADTVIGKPLQPGGVSGGERRRVSIAAEVQHDPSLVLLDEPTSGLDAATALVVVQLLRERANRSDRPAAVVLSIHQPRATIPPLLDNVLLLAAGRDMYFGPTWTLDASGAPSQDGILGYLSSVGHPAPLFDNPADYLLDLVNTRVDGDGDGDSLDATKQKNDKGNRVDPATDEAVTVEVGTRTMERRGRKEVVRKLAEAWAGSQMHKELFGRAEGAGKGLKLPVRSGAGSSGFVCFMRRFYALWMRVTLFKLREPQVTMTQFSNAVFVPLIFGAVYWRMSNDVSALGDHVAAISLTVLMQSFLAFDQLTLFPKERALYLHESKGGLYGTALFYMTRTMGEVPGQTIFGWLCAAITYEMYGFRDDTGARLTYYAIIVLSTLAGASVLTCVGAMCKDMDQSNAASSILLLFMIVDGQWVNLENIPPYLKWLQELSFMGWGVQASVVNEFRGIEFTCQLDPETQAPVRPGCEPLTGDEAIASVSMTGVSIGRSIMKLIVFQIVARLCAFLALHFCWTGETLGQRARRLVGKLGA